MKWSGRSSRRSRGSTLALAWLAALAVFALGCATHDYYRSYAEAHPGWVAELPQDEISVEELVAAIHAPPPLRNVTTLVTHLKLLGLGTDPWETIPLDSLRDGSFEANPSRLYIVVSRVECSYYSSAYRRDSRESERWLSSAFNGYVVRDERLLAFDHRIFEHKCDFIERERGRSKQIEGFEDKLWEVAREWGARPDVR